MLLQNRLKANAISRSNAGIMSYENGAYEESAYVQHGQNHKILIFSLEINPISWGFAETNLYIEKSEFLQIIL